MQKLMMPAVVAGVVLSIAIPIATAAEMSKEEMIASAESAAPRSVGQNATIVGFGDKMQAVVLRQGTNDVTCMSDDPTTPSVDPKCFYKNGVFVIGEDTPYDRFLMGPIPSK